MLEMLDCLRTDGFRGGVTIGLTAVLLEQLAEGDVRANFDGHLGCQKRRTASALARRL